MTYSYWLSVRVYIPADIYARYLRLCGKDVVLSVVVTSMELLFRLKHLKRKQLPVNYDKYDEIIGKSFKNLEFPLIITLEHQTNYYDTASDFSKN